MKKQFSALELTKAFLDRIKKRNKKLFAVLTISENQAILQAKKVDDLISQKRKLPMLAGIPCLIKDNILVKDIRCTAGSKILENYIAPYNATCIKLLKEQGTVILGKANLDEFAIGSSGERSAFGRTLNPCDLRRVPGGSSSGPAAAVADRQCIFALGSDTGGSIRLPASFCGVVGLKPTYGAVSRFGLVAMASSLDQIGPLTKTAEDARIIFEAISKRDPLDSTSIEIPKTEHAKRNIRNAKIGVPKEYFIKGINKEVEKETRGAIKKFEKLGAKIKEISLPHTKYALATYYIIMTSEVSANLARYDGIKYGSHSSTAPNLLNVYLKTRQQYLGEEVKRRIMLGTYSLSAGYYQAYYLRAQKVRSLIREDFNRAFQKVDLILTPTSPTPPFKIGEKIKDPLLMYLSDIFMIAVNLAGLPAISFPCPVRNSVNNELRSKSGAESSKHEISNGACGQVKSLPVGLQIIGKPFKENEILELSQSFEKWK
jgi:aspartyl-tRNA(Asn)/glutamyl-tRNA(Gln) amidotransferase subunit A